jgi:hypothetical protein
VGCTLGSADVLVFDCLRPALDALGLSEDKDAGRFLEAVDELAAEAGIREVLVVHHMGHGDKERARGDSRIIDWPDAVWSLVRQGDPDDPEAPRFFSAYGRDVAQAEVALGYDRDTRHLSVVGGSRKAVHSNALRDAVLAFVVAEPGCSQRAVEEGVTGDRLAVRVVLKRLVAEGDVLLKKGARNANMHYPAEDTDVI